MKKFVKFEFSIYAVVPVDTNFCTSNITIGSVLTGVKTGTAAQNLNLHWLGKTL